MPFISVSCNSIDIEISLSGLDMAVGKEVNRIPINGNLLVFILIIPSVILLIAGFAKLPDLAENIAHVAVAILNCTMAFGIKIVIDSKVHEIAAGDDFGFGGFLVSAIKINIKFGFALYIAMSVLLLATGIILLAAYSHKRGD